jgi:hypothetical protein
MPVLPDRGVELIEFGELHGQPWIGVAAQIGLTVASATQVKNDANAARAKYQSAIAARAAARQATLELNTTLSTLRTSCANAVRSIKAFAEQQPNPDTVYAIAQIPAPQPPSPAEAPGKPENIRIGLNPDGSISFTWKSKNSTSSEGASFRIYRRLPTEEGFAQVGSSSSKSFTDAQLRQGTTSAAYIIRGYRNETPGEASDQINVQFGVGGGGGLASGASGSSGGVTFSLEPNNNLNVGESKAA